MTFIIFSAVGIIAAADNEVIIEDGFNIYTGNLSDESTLRYKITPTVTSNYYFVCLAGEIDADWAFYPKDEKNIIYDYTYDMV